MRAGESWSANLALPAPPLSRRARWRCRARTKGSVALGVAADGAPAARAHAAVPAALSEAVGAPRRGAEQRLHAPPWAFQRSRPAGDRQRGRGVGAAHRVRPAAAPRASAAASVPVKVSPAPMVSTTSTTRQPAIDAAAPAGCHSAQPLAPSVTSTAPTPRAISALRRVVERRIDRHAGDAHNSVSLGVITSTGASSSAGNARAGAGFSSVVTPAARADAKRGERGRDGHLVGRHHDAARGQRATRRLDLRGPEPGAGAGRHRDAVVAVVEHEDLRDAAGLALDLLDMLSREPFALHRAQRHARRNRPARCVRSAPCAPPGVHTRRRHSSPCRRG